MAFEYSTFYKSIERYLPFLLLGCLHDAMSTVLEGLNLVQHDRVMFDSKFQTDPYFKLPFMNSFVLTCDYCSSQHSGIH
jgi:hypothetical protein